MVADSLIQLLPFQNTALHILPPVDHTCLPMLHHLVPGRNEPIVDSRFVGSSWVSVYQLSLVTFDASILILRMIVCWIESLSCSSEGAGEIIVFQLLSWCGTRLPSISYIYHATLGALCSTIPKSFWRVFQLHCA
jgi:hypothetical protein